MKVFPTYHETEERAPVHTWQRWSLKSRWERRTGSAFIHIHAIHGVVIHFPRPRRNLRTSSQVRMCEFCWIDLYCTGVTHIIPCIGILHIDKTTLIRGADLVNGSGCVPSFMKII